MVLNRVLGNLLIFLGLVLGSRAFVNNSQVDLFMAQYVAPFDQSVMVDGFDPPNDEERPGSTVG
ncbi:MAG: hypothetical protein EAZ61_00405 [Oscillatoriales cyanobacterium]|jgi:hypothetical protein|nr:MAG: hypothetical protein EAZ61_00405 [Oscillatoriales cyanobacterium]